MSMKKSILLAFVPPSVRSPLLWMHFLIHPSKQYTLRVTVMRLTFIHRDTFLIRQVMREYLGSDEMLSANDRSYLLRLKNARSASRCSSYSSGRNSHAMRLTFACRTSSSVGPSHSRTALQPRCTFCSDLELFFCHVFSLLFSILYRSPPVNPRESPRSQDLQATQLPNKRFTSKLTFC